MASDLSWFPAICPGQGAGHTWSLCLVGALKPDALLFLSGPLSSGSPGMFGEFASVLWRSMRRIFEMPGLFFFFYARYFCCQGNPSTALWTLVPLGAAEVSRPSSVVPSLPHVQKARGGLSPGTEARVARVASAQA